MDNYDHIAQDLKHTINEYKHNLESLKERFADIGNIINHLDQLKLQAQNSASKGVELNTKAAELESKNSELFDKMISLSADYDSELTNLKTQHSEWNRAVDGLVQEVSVSITDLRSDYTDKLNKALSEIAVLSKQEATALNQYLQNISRTQLTEIERVKQELDSNICHSVNENSSQITELVKNLSTAVEGHINEVDSSFQQNLEGVTLLLIEKLDSLEKLSEKKMDDIRIDLMDRLIVSRWINVGGFIILTVFILMILTYISSLLQ